MVKQVCAHVLPASEKKWFGANGTDEYRTSNSKAGEDVVDAECNMFLPRQGIYSLCDKMKFIIFLLSLPARLALEVS